MRRFTEGLVGYEELIKHHKEHHLSESILQTRIEKLVAEGAGAGARHAAAAFTVASPKEFMVGEFYWIRQVHERVWRPCYVFQDPEDNVWILTLGFPEAFPATEGDLTNFEFASLSRPDKQ